MRNIAASHRAKLLALARDRGEDFQFLLGRWVVERFLFRLANSSLKESFVLKGATLFLAWEGRLHRPTRDLDLLGFGSPEVDDVTRRIRAICAVPADDGIVFDLGRIQGERIKEDAEYEGVRVRVPTRLDGARVSLQVDVGFGDLVDPPPAEITIPVLLLLDAPVVRAYPPEAVIAEKFHAMVVLGIANTRMKDFFDLWTLARSRQFDLNRLAHSFRNTFERRRTALPQRLPLALTSEFLDDASKQVQWLGIRQTPGLKRSPCPAFNWRADRCVPFACPRHIRRGRFPRADLAARWSLDGRSLSTSLHSMACRQRRIGMINGRYEAEGGWGLSSGRSRRPARRCHNGSGLGSYF